MKLPSVLEFAVVLAVSGGVSYGVTKQYETRARVAQQQALDAFEKKIPQPHTYAAAGGADPQGSGYYGGASGRASITAYAGDGGQVAGYADSGVPAGLPFFVMGSPQTDLAVGTGQVLIPEQETVFGLGTTNQVFGFAGPTVTTTNASAQGYGIITSPQNSVGKWNLSVTAVFINDGGAGGGWLGYDAGLQDYATWDATFVTSYVASQSDGGTTLIAFNPPTITSAGGLATTAFSCSGAGCVLGGWSVNPFNSTTFEISVTGAASTTVHWSVELQYAQKQ